MQALPPGRCSPCADRRGRLRRLLTPALSLAASTRPPCRRLRAERRRVGARRASCTVAASRHAQLVTSHAFHSEMMDPILDPFAAVVAEVPRQAPTIPFVSSVTGNWITAEEATDPAYWARHLREPVRFADGVGAPARGSRERLSRSGQDETLTTLLRSTPTARQPEPPSSPWRTRRPRDRHLVDALAGGRLWIAGASLDWAGVQAVGGAAACRCRPTRSSASATGSSLHPGRVAPMSFRVSRRTASPCHRRPRLPRSP